jgi:transposase-like protein
MVQRGRETAFEERMEISERWEAGQTDPEIAAAVGRPIPTVRKWRRKYEREGRSGLVSCSELPQPQAVEPERAHEEWEVDAQGVIKVADLGSVSIININDLFNRLKVDSFPCLNTSHPNMLDYQVVLRRAFLRYGLPERVSLDHDSVFYDNASASPYPMTLHLWLIALGVEVRSIQQKPPAEHSVIERAHQTMNQQAVADQTFADGSALQHSLSDRLDFLNHRFPSRSLGGQPPLVACPEAQHSGRFYRLEWEKDMLDSIHPLWLSGSSHGTPHIWGYGIIGEKTRRICHVEHCGSQITRHDFNSSGYS